MITTQMIIKDLIFFAPLMGLLALDLFMHRKNPEQSFKDALIWSAAWVGLALCFNVYVYYSMGLGHAINFLTGYVVEQSLSVDNLFVIMMIFSYFHVPKVAQHRVLFWGILGAFIFRGLFIFAGISLIQKFHITIVIFGAFLVFTGIKTAFQKKESPNLEKNFIVRFMRKLLPVSDEYHGDKFSFKKNGKRWLTPLFVALVVVELTDVVFAVDSIPAILAITTDPFIVITSNFFAILGLRSLYFVLQHFLKYFHYLKYGLGVILSFVGVKMMVSLWIKIPVLLSLSVILLTLVGTVILSLVFPPKSVNDI